MIRGLILYIIILLLFPHTASGGGPGSQLIHATVTWENGESRTGYLRWENEEATWDDLFHCGYRKSPWADFIDHKALKKEKRTRYFETHGLFDRLKYALNEEDKPGPGWRMFLIRFGDIQEFEIHSGEDDFIITADGSRHRIGGYANDDGSDLWLYVKGQQPLEISWNDLTSIKFSAAPDDFPPFADRLHGTVQTTHGSFTGPIMWDKSECLSIDILNGKNDQGDQSVAMGKIRSIEKKNSQSVHIVEKDGRTYDMQGSNDVNRNNRGIWILSNDQGWINVPWKRFRKVTFKDGPWRVMTEISLETANRSMVPSL